MRRTKEQSEAATNIKECQRQQALLSQRKIALASLLQQQWENYRTNRVWNDLLLLLTMLSESNLIDGQLEHWKNRQAEYEQQMKQKPAQIPSSVLSERIKNISSELRELNKQKKAAEKEAANALAQSVSVMEFMQVEDIVQLILTKISTLTKEKKALQQKVKEIKKESA